jgi:hypothetical protein
LDMSGEVEVAAHPHLALMLALDVRVLDLGQRLGVPGVATAGQIQCGSEPRVHCVKVLGVWTRCRPGDPREGRLRPLEPVVAAVISSTRQMLIGPLRRLSHRRRANLSLWGTRGE